MAEQIGRGAAEDEKARGERPAVGQDAQEWEQIGPALNLINHHQFLEWTQSGVGLGQTSEALGILEIEVVERVGRDKLAGEGGLAALSGTQKRNHAAAPQGGADQRNVGETDDHEENCIP